MWCFLKSSNTSAMLQTLHGSRDTSISLCMTSLPPWLFINHNPKISKELTKAKCELCLTSQNLQFHFSTESPASLCVTSQSWKLTTSWIWPDFDHLSRHIVIISKIKQKNNNAKHIQKRCQNLTKANKELKVSKSSNDKVIVMNENKDIAYDDIDNVGADDDDGDGLGLAWPLRHETTTSGILASSHSKSLTRQAVLPFQHDQNEDDDNLTKQFFLFKMVKMVCANACLAIFGIFGRVFGRPKYGQVGYPWKDLAKCSSDALTLCQ